MNPRATAWPEVRLRHWAQLNPPPPAQLDPDADVSFLPMEAIGEDGVLDLSRTRPVREAARVKVVVA